MKKCGLSENCGPSEHYWWQDECDRKSDEDSYTCSTCCSHTMCNSASPTLTSLAGLFLSLYVSLNKSSNSCRSLSFLSGFIYVLIKSNIWDIQIFSYSQKIDHHSVPCHPPDIFNNCFEFQFIMWNVENDFSCRTIFLQSYFSQTL